MPCTYNCLYSSAFVQCPVNKLQRRKEIHSSNDGLQTPLRKGTRPHESCLSATSYPVSIFSKSVQGYKNSTLELCRFAERSTGFVWRETSHLPGQIGRFTIQANDKRQNTPENTGGTGKFRSIAFTGCTNQFHALENDRESVKLVKKIARLLRLLDVSSDNNLPSGTTRSVKTKS